MRLMFVLLLALAIGCDNNQRVTPLGHPALDKHGAGDEESGTQYTKDEVYDQTRGEARLVIAYDPILKAFTGTVENISDSVLPNVRIEVHLSNGVELGPTVPKNLAPMEKVEVILDATGQAFDTWSAHAEIG